MTAFRLGINTCFAVKRWPQPEEWVEVVRGELGLDLVQHSLDLVDLDADEDGLAAQAEALNQASVRGGVELSSTFTGLVAYSSSLLLHPDASARRRAHRWYERVLTFSARAGARRAGGHVGSLSVRDYADLERRDVRWRELVASLEALGRYAHRAGLECLLVENMACRREPSVMGDIHRLLNRGDEDRVPIELCLDVGHQCIPGTSDDERDPYGWLQRLGARAPIVHLQQTDANGDHHWPFTPEYDARGRVVPERVLDSLLASGAQEVELIVEVVPPFEQDDEEVIAELQTTVARWREALRPLGPAT